MMFHDLDTAVQADSRERGSALLLALMVALVLVFLGMGMLLQTSLGLEAAGTDRWVVKALYAADAGTMLQIEMIRLQDISRPGSIRLADDPSIPSLWNPGAPAMLQGEFNVEIDDFCETQQATPVVQEVNGSPASGVWIQSLGGGLLGPMVASTCTAGGRCEVNDLPRGRWTLLIQGEGLALVVADIPQTEIPVRLRAAGRLEINATGEESGAAWQVRLSEAATGVVVPVGQYDNPGRGEWVPVAASGLDLRMPEGAWRIEAFAPDGTQSVQQATVTAGGTTEVLLE